MAGDPNVSFAARVLEVVGTTATVCELACGSNVAVGRKLRREGHEGSLLFVDWIPNALALHEAGFGADLSARWVCAPAFTMRVDTSAWLIAHRTLPRWEDRGQLVKPRGPTGGARLLRELVATGARGLVALTLGEETVVLREGATLLGMSIEEEREVAWEDDRAPGVGTMQVVRFR